MARAPKNSKKAEKPRPDSPPPTIDLTEDSPDDPVTSRPAATQPNRRVYERRVKTDKRRRERDAKHKLHRDKARRTQAHQEAIKQEVPPDEPEVVAAPPVDNSPIISMTLNNFCSRVSQPIVVLHDIQADMHALQLMNPLVTAGEYGRMQEFVQRDQRKRTQSHLGLPSVASAMAQGGSDLELAGTSYYSRTLDNVDRTSELSVRIDGLQIAPVAPLVPYSDNESDKSDEEEEIEVEKEVEVEETEKEVEFEDEDVEVEVEIETEVEEDVAVEVEIETEVEKEVEKAYSEVEDSEKDIAEEEVEKETNENSEVEENSDVDVEENLEKEIAAEKEGNSEVDENSEVEVEENLEKEIPAENSEVEKEVEDEVDESPDVNVEENSDKETPEEYPSPACNSDSDQISEDEQQSSGEEFVVDKKCPDFTYYKHNINVERRRTRSMAFATPLELMEEDQEEYSEPEFVPKKIMKKRGRKKVVEPVLSDFGDDNGYNNDEYPRFNYTMREPTAEERETGKRLMNGHSEGSNESFMDAENSQSSLPVATPTADTTDNEITSESLPENAEDELKNAYESGTDGDNEESSDDEHFDDSPGPVEENNNTQAVEKVPEVAAPKANSDDVIEVSEDSQETPKKIVDTENAPTVIEHDPLEIPDDSQETTDNNNNEKTAGEDSTAENSVEAAKEIQDTERDQEKIPEANNQRSPPTFEISDDESPKDSQNDMDTADDETVLDEENVFAKETENILAKMAEYHNATDDNKDISNTPDDNSNVPEPSPENNDTLNDNSEDSNSSQESSYSSEDSGSDESERDEENVQVKETEIVHDENSHRTKATDDHKVQDIFDSPDENSNVPEPSPENFENDNAEDSDTVCEWPYFTVVLQNPQMDTANDEPERDEENAEQDQNYGNSPNAAEDTAEDSKQGKDSEKSQRTEENVENDEDSRDLSEVSMDIDDTQTESKMENVPKTAAENPAKNETERDENIRDSPMDIDDDEMENLPMEAEVPKIPQTTSETETNETVPEKTAIIPTPEHYTGISDNDTLEAKDIENTEADLEVEKYTAEAPESEVLESSSDSSHLQTPECLQSGILPHHFKIIKSSPEEDPNLAKFNEMSSDDEDRGGSEIVVVPQPRRHVNIFKHLPLDSAEPSSDRLDIVPEPVEEPVEEIPTVFSVPSSAESSSDGFDKFPQSNAAPTCSNSSNSKNMLQTVLKHFNDPRYVLHNGPLTELSSLFRGYFGAARSDSPVLGYQIPEPSIDIQNDDIMAPQIVATKPMAVEIEVETEENAPQIAEQFKVINNDDVDTGEDNFAEEMPPELELSHEEIVETEEPLQDLIEAQPSLPEEEIAAKVPAASEIEELVIDPMLNLSNSSGASWRNVTDPLSIQVDDDRILEPIIPTQFNNSSPRANNLNANVQACIRNINSYRRPSVVRRTLDAKENRNFYIRHMIDKAQIMEVKQACAAQYHVQETADVEFIAFIRPLMDLMRYVPSPLSDRGFSDFPQNEPLTTKQLESRKRARDEEDEEMNDAKRPRK